MELHKSGFGIRIWSRPFSGITAQLEFVNKRPGGHGPKSDLLSCVRVAISSHLQLVRRRRRRRLYCKFINADQNLTFKDNNNNNQFYVSTYVGTAIVVQYHEISISILVW